MSFGTAKPIFLGWLCRIEGRPRGSIYNTTYGGESCCEGRQIDGGPIQIDHGIDLAAVPGHVKMCISNTIENFSPTVVSLSIS
eukprot:scaffold1836_cov204-Alexandrium_tamarense.AAC.7